MTNQFENSHNPVLPLEHHVPDCEAHVMPDGKLYLYGTYDARDDVYCSGEYHVVSTEDMKHWEVHGISFEGKDVPWFINPDAPALLRISCENSFDFAQCG